MNRALFWKEWREQRPIVIAGLALALAMPFVLAAGAIGFGQRANLAASAMLFPVVLWPLLAVACGASTISSEIGEGTLGFLLSRPVSRLRVWLVKVATAWLALLVIMAGSLAIIAVFSFARGGELLREPTLGARDPIVSALLPNQLLLLAGSLLLLFSGSVFCSTFVSRTMTAAAAGLVISLVIGTVLFLVWGRIGVSPGSERDLLALQLNGVGLLMLLASLAIFTAGELLSGRRVLLLASLAGVGALGATFVVSVPVAAARMQLEPDSALLWDIRLVPARNALVTTAHGEWGSSPQVWLIHLDGSGIERLSGRLAGWSAVSPDGRLVAYLSVRGALGLRSGRASLHVVGIDGTGERVVVPDLGKGLPYLPHLDPHEPVEIHWSPDGDRIAFSHRFSLVVASLDGAFVTRSLERSTDPLRNFGLIGWSKDGSELLLLGTIWERRSETPTHLLAYEPSSGRVREVFKSERRRFSLGDGEQVVADKVSLMLGQPIDRPADEGPYSLVEVNVVDGTTRTLFEGPCLTGFGISADQGTLVYGGCPLVGSSPGAAEIRFHDRASGSERATPPLPGRSWQMYVSPDAQWVAVRRGSDRPDGAVSALAVRSDGTVTSFPGSWSPLGWTGKSGVVLAEAGQYGIRRIAVGDAESGEVRDVFP